MPRSSSFSDAFNGSLRGLGDIGTAINDKRRTDASVAASNASAANSIAETEGRKSAFARLTKEDALKASLASATKDRISLPDSVSNPMPSKPELLLYSQLTGKSPEEITANISRTKSEATGSDLENQGKKQTIDFNTNLMPKKLIGVDLDNQKTVAETNKLNSSVGDGHFSPVPLANGNIGNFDTKKGTIGDTGQKGVPKQSEIPIDVKSEVSALSGKTGTKISIANQLQSHLNEFKKAATDDDKVRIGNEMLKIINSTEGSDAVGTDERKNLGNALDYHIASLPSAVGITPGKFHGRDLDGFETQAQATVNSINNAVKENRKSVDGIMGRTPVVDTNSNPTTPPADAHPQDSEAVMWAKSNPTDPRAMKILQANGL